MSETRDGLERALELLVYAPIGAGLYLRDVAPPILETVVALGRAEFDRRQADVQRHVTSARSLGQVAIAFGCAEAARARRRGTRPQRGLRAGPTPASAPEPVPGAPAPPKFPPTPTPVPGALAVVASEQSCAPSATSSRFPATTRCRRRKSSSGSRGSAAPSSTPCTRTRPRIATAARSSARSNSSPAD